MFGLGCEHLTAAVPWAGATVVACHFTLCLSTIVSLLTHCPRLNSNSNIKKQVEVSVIPPMRTFLEDVMDLRDVS